MTWSFLGVIGVMIGLIIRTTWIWIRHCKRHGASLRTMIGGPRGHWRELSQRDRREMILLYMLVVLLWPLLRFL